MANQHDGSSTPTRTLSFWYFTDGNYATLEEAIEVGGWIIQTGKPR